MSKVKYHEAAGHAHGTSDANQSLLHNLRASALREKTEIGENRLATLIDMDDPDAVVAEVKIVISTLFPTFDLVGLVDTFSDTKKLFRGEFPDYRACNTEYHNLHHTTDCFLAMARVIHGAATQGETFHRENVLLGLLAALFHDTGYVQTEDDGKGTGAKYTLVHIQRSIDFMTAYLRDRSFPENAILDGKQMLKCTGLNVKIQEIPFSSHEIKVLGKMLGTADLLGQMADRAYLEKLLFLYHEFREGKVPGYGSEMEFLYSSIAFFKTTKDRLATELGGMKRYMAPHFKSRWNIDADLYEIAIQRNQEYLRDILKDHGNKHRDRLRRGKITEKLIKRGL